MRSNPQPELPKVTEARVAQSRPTATGQGNQVLIPLAGVGILVLSEEAFREGLANGQELTPKQAFTHAIDVEPLLDAHEAARRLGVTARWLEDSARAGIVPHHRFGRFIRFRVSDIAAHCRITGALVTTDSQSVRAF